MKKRLSDYQDKDLLNDIAIKAENILSQKGKISAIDLEEHFKDIPFLVLSALLSQIVNSQMIKARYSKVESIVFYVSTQDLN